MKAIENDGRVVLYKSKNPNSRLNFQENTAKTGGFPHFNF